MIASALRHLTRFTGAAGGAILLLALPAAAADFQVENVRLELGAIVIAAPKIEVKGSPLERETFLSLFNGSTGESAVARMSRLSAAEIRAPELTIEQAFGPQRQVTSYREIRFSDVREGKIARGEAAGGAIKVAGGAAGAMSGEIKRLSFEGFDLRHMARVLTERAQPGVTEAMQPLFMRFEQDGYALDLGPLGKMSLGKTIGRDFLAKVGAEPLMDVITRAVALSDAAEKVAGDSKAKPDPEQREAEKRMGLSILALFDQFDQGSGEVRDMVMALVTPPKAGAKAEAVNVRIARIAYGADTPAKSGFAVEGLQFTGGGAKGVIDSISHSGFSFGSALQALREELARPDSTPDTLDFRRFIPTLGTLRLAGLSVDAPQPSSPGGLPGGTTTIKVGLGLFELKGGEPLNGVPTSLSLILDNLRAPMVERAGNPAARDLIAMGYREVDLSAKIDLAWNAAKSELSIGTISLGGAGMAKLEASGTLGNVTKDLFSSDLALAQVAALGATARVVQAKLQNFGLIEKAIENEARKSKRKPEDLRREYATMASLGLAAILGPSDAAKTLTAAVARFAAKPGTLSVTASAKSQSGLGLADVITISNPADIFDKIDVKANAE